MTEDEYINVKNIAVLGAICSSCKDLLFSDDIDKKAVSDFMTFIEHKRGLSLGEIKIEEVTND